MPEEQNQSSPIPTQQTEAPKSSLIQKLKNKFNSLRIWAKANPKKSIVIALISLFLFGIGVNFVAAQFYKKTEESSGPITKVVQVDRFVLVASNPSDREENVPLDQKITFTFNQEVKPHVFGHSFSIDPKVVGTFEPGKTSREVVFKPLGSYKTGVRYKVFISSNLRSASGEFLDRDYSLNFNTDLVGNKVSFIENGLDNFLMSFPKNKEVELTIMKGTTVRGAVTVNLYQAQTDQLLPSLAYEEKTITYPGGSYTNEEFVGNKVDTSKMKKLDTFNNLEDKSSLKVKKDIGLYYLEATNDKNERLGESWISFNSTGLLLRQDDKKVYLATQDLFTGQSVSGVEVSLYNLKNQVNLLAKDKIDDKKEISLNYPTRLDLVIGKIGSDTLLVPVSVPESQAYLAVSTDLSKRNQIFLYTDRPIYKKGDTIFYRGVLRKDNDALYSLPPKGQVVRVYAEKYVDGKTINILDQKVSVDGSGIFSGQFTADDNFIGDYQSIYATTTGDTNNIYSGVASFDVKTYSKPTFDISVKNEKSEVILGDKINATIIARNNNGSPLANQEISYGYRTNPYYQTDKAVFNKNFNIGHWGGMCSGDFGVNDIFIDDIEQKAKKVKTDSSGKATITIDSGEIEDKSNQTITIIAFKLDDKGNKVFGADSSIARQGDINIFIRQRQTTYYTGEEATIQFYSESLNGEKQANKEFNYEIISTNYDSKTNKTIQTTLLTGKTTTNEDGLGIIHQKLNLKNNSYILRISGTDGSGREVRADSSFYLYEATEENRIYYEGYGSWGNPEKVYLDVISEKNSYQVGEKANLKITSPDDGRALVTFERGRVYKYDWLDLKKGDNNYEISLTEELSPSFAVVFSYFKNGAYISEGLYLNVPAMHKLVNVEIKADKDKYAPGEKAKLTINTKNNSGQGVSAKISLAVVDKAIYILRKDFTKAIHSAFYYYRPLSTNASSSLTRIGEYGGGGGGGGGDGNLADKLVDTLYWNPNLQTDANGNASVEIQLNSYETTWRTTVYASTDNSQVGQEFLDFTVGQ